MLHIPQLFSILHLSGPTQRATHCLAYQWPSVRVSFDLGTILPTGFNTLTLFTILPTGFKSLTLFGEPELSNLSKNE